ncbi:unnamed protein product [Phytophthora lilii]|uniref:Unnamed protein product n=1 Tax=Phytophthora lilii TaxID=2077276 RepID=A0A9W6TJB1_9STRA|nr:unnamed protein product [Phytophthora lilii]
MRRSTPGERQWENALRRDSRTTDGSVGMKSPPERGSSAPRRPPANTNKPNENAFASTTSLVATAALQAYLSNDIDARSRIPGPHRTVKSTRKEVSKSAARQEGRRLSCAPPYRASKPMYELFTFSTARSMADLESLGVSIQVKKSRAVSSVQPSLPCPIPAVHPCRIQKGAKASGPQNLTRLLKDKIQEAKRLRLVTTASSGTVEHQLNLGARSCNLHNYKLLEGGSACLLESENLLHASSKEPKSESVLQSEVSMAKSAPLAPSVSSINTPPIPHEKPVMPTLPLLSPKPLLEVQATKGKKSETPNTNLRDKPGLRDTTSSINNVIAIANAVSLIQRMWRQSRQMQEARDPDMSENIQVSLVIDKNSASQSLTPLFPAAYMKYQRMMKDEKNAENELCQAVNEYKAKSSSTMDSKEVISTDGPENIYQYEPWTDQELVFLEEGRCVGELDESVRKGVFMDDNELVWKRPQHIIQQLETQRIAAIQKARRRPTSTPLTDTLDSDQDITGNIVPASPLPPAHSLLQDPLPQIDVNEPSLEQCERRKPRICIRKHSRKMVLSRVKTLPAKVGKITVQRAKTSRWRQCIGADTSEKVEQRQLVVFSQGPSIENDQVSSNSVDNQTINNAGQQDPSLSQSDESKDCSSPNMLDRFVLFSNSDNMSNDEDCNSYRNDLVSVGDLALARSLLRQKGRCNQGSNAETERHNGFIPLKHPSPLLSSRKSIGEASDKPSSTKSEALLDTVCARSQDNDLDYCFNVDSSNSGDVRARLNSSDVFSDRHQITHLEDDPKVFEPPHLLWSCDDMDLHPEGKDDNSNGNNSLASSALPPPSESNNLLAEEETPEMSLHSGTDPMRALVVMKSAVVETMAQIHTKYRDDTASDDQAVLPNQLSELPSLPPPPFSAAAVTRPHLDEAKRIEFLRVLDDFKRCLRASCASSTATCSIGANAD